MVIGLEAKVKLLVGALAAAVLALSLGGCAGGQAGEAASGQTGSAGMQTQVSADADAVDGADGEDADGAAGESGGQTPAAGALQMPTEAPADTTGGSPWIDSNIPGNATADMDVSPADDFYLWANRDWIASTQIPEGARTTGVDMQAEAYEQVRSVVAGADLQGHDARQAQLLYRTAADVDARNAAACEPARATVEDIRSLASIDDVSAFLLDAERSAGVPTFIRIRNRADAMSGRYVTQVGLSPTTFDEVMGAAAMDAAATREGSELYQARLALASAVLTGVGYTADEAKAAFENRLELEGRIQAAAEEAEDAEDPEAAEAAEDDEAATPGLTFDDLDEIAAGFPLRALAESRGYGAAKDIQVNDEAELRAAAAFYTQDNLELIRDYLICGYALEVGAWLDERTFAAWLADYGARGFYDRITATDPADAEAMAFCITTLAVPTPVGRAFVEGCDLEHSKEFVEGLCAEAIVTHKQLVGESEWLSDASKARLAQKLDELDVQAVYPEAWEDYSALDLDGLDYFAARRAIWLSDVARNAAHTGAEVDARLWSDPTLLGSTARYDAETNSFRVAAGITEPYVGRYLAGEMTLAELLGGGVGYAVFHETAHALDTTSIYYDGNGDDVEESLLAPADLAEYQRRVRKIAGYFDSITAWAGQQVIGEVCTNEALAEMCGMRARLAYAADKEGFDYRAFFQERATKINRALRTPLFELQCLYGADPHPLGYLDVNVTVQQCDEFYDAFDVREGDAMYLAPESRLLFW